MDSSFATDLKSALVARADDVTTDAVQRVTTADYHPRHHRRRTMTIWGTGGAMTLAAAVAAGVGVFGPGVPDAFASWTPHTSVPADGQIAAAELACSQEIQMMVQSIPATSGAAGVSATAWQPAIEDVRGPFTLVAFRATDGSSGLASCLTGGSSWTGGPQLTLSDSDGHGISVTGSKSAADGTGIPVTQIQTQGFAQGFLGSLTPPASGDVGNPATDWNSASNDQVALGLAGAGVTAVNLVLSDDTAVQATVANGLYAAWWPGSTRVSSVSYTNSTGTFSRTLPAK